MKLLTVGPVKPVYQPPKNISTHEQQTCTAISDGDTVVLVSKRVFGLNNLLRAHSGLRDEKTAWLVKTTFRRRVGTTNPTVEQTKNSAGGWLTFSSLCDTKRTRVSLLLCSSRRTKPQNVCRSPHTYPHRPHCDTTVVKPRCKVNTEVTFSFWFTSGRTLFWLQSVVRQQGISSWFCCGLPVVISRKLSPHPAPNVF